MLDVAVVGMGWWGKTLVNLISKSAKLRVVKGMKRIRPLTDYRDYVSLLTGTFLNPTIKST